MTATSTNSLVLKLASSTQSVSAFHSPLRTTQAAACEAAQSSPEGAAAFAACPAPQLVRAVTSASAEGLQIEFRFSRHRPPITPHIPYQ